MRMSELVRQCLEQPELTDVDLRRRLEQYLTFVDTHPGEDVICELDELEKVQTAHILQAKS
jgi:hypothetical protein